MPERKAVLITFSVKSERFTNNSERNKFFRMLYGWNQSLTKNKKIYTYRREGLLDEIPHQKVDQSSFIVDIDDFDKIIDFFEEWTDKVFFKTFKVLLDENVNLEEEE